MKTNEEVAGKASELLDATMSPDSDRSEYDKGFAQGQLISLQWVLAPSKTRKRVKANKK
jgi:hypothetical protein|tara:strand:+ start:2826 stop:3002 length:177 start_codon:yes stop_codon:yes gene_type:complete